jgi:DNA-directed RNA polymerase specialized sigma subunit
VVVLKRCPCLTRAYGNTPLHAISASVNNIDRFGEDILSEAVFILYDKIKSYDLRYRDKNGKLKPVKFSSYIWKRIDGFILDSLKKELKRDRCQASLDW